jgi:hypothetical protein
LIRRGSVLTAVLAAAVMFGPLSAGPAAGAAKQPPAGAVVLGQLRGILAQLADEYGEPDPTHMRMVETISPALGDLRPSIPVYVVVANGHFAERDTLWPNLRAQTGTTLEIVLTRPAEEVDSWRLMRHNAELRKLGTVQALDATRDGTDSRPTASHPRGPRADRSASDAHAGGCDQLVCGGELPHVRVCPRPTCCTRLRSVREGHV